MKTSEDPAVVMWSEAMHDYAKNHTHDTCDDCDPWVLAADAIETYDETDGCDCAHCLVDVVLNTAIPALLHRMAVSEAVRCLKEKGIDDPLREGLQLSLNTPNHQ